MHQKQIIMVGAVGVAVGSVITGLVALQQWHQEKPLPQEGASRVTHTPRPPGVREVARFSVTGKVVEVDQIEGAVRIQGNNRDIYTVSVGERTEIMRKGAKITLNEIMVGEEVSAITDKDIGDSLSFEATSLYVREKREGGTIPL